MHTIEIADEADPRLDDFRNLTDQQARMRRDEQHGTYIAESLKVLSRAVEAGHTVVRVLTQPKWLDDLEAVVPQDTEVLVVDAEFAERIAGFAVHRGVIAVMARPQLLSVTEILANARTVIIADDITDHTNIGSLFRSAAALGADAVVISPRGADPLYRRSVRVSMGGVLQVPWTRATSWPSLRRELVGAGFEVVALALTHEAEPLRDYAPGERVALVVGTEGDGLGRVALAHADRTVMIPMRPGIDSLNVATAASIALWAVTGR